MGFRKWSLSVKLTLGVTFLVSVAVAVVTLLSMYTAQRGYRSEAERQARSMLGSLGTAAAGPLSAGESGKLTELARSARDASPVQLVWFYDAQGRPVVRSGDGQPESDSWLEAFGQRAVGSDSVVFDWRSDQMVAGQALVVGGERVGAVVVGLSAAPLQERLAGIRNVGLGVVAAAVALGTLFALWVSRSLGTALREMAGAVDRMARGDLSRPLAARGGELEVLARALNRLLTSLQEGSAPGGAVVQAILEGIVCVDHDGWIIAANPAAQRMFGYGRDEMFQRKISDLIAPSSLEGKTRQTLSYYLSKGRGSLFGRRIEGTGVHADGKRFPVEWGITRLSAGEPWTFAVIVHDISERKQAEVELRQAKEAAQAANEAKSAFVAHVSHELRTPLTSVIGYADFLQQEVLRRGYVDLSADLERVRTAAEHLREVVSDIIDLSRIEAGKLELHLETFELASLVDDVLAISRPLAERNGNVLRIEVSPGVGAMHADRTKVQQILLNLVSNAAKYTRHGSIMLSVAREVGDGDDWVSFRIADSGIGMTSEQVDHLFQPFSQLDPSVAGTYEGSGLGLAITRGLCQAMGGEISVVSAPGQGSTFTVRLPAVVPPAHGAQLSPSIVEA